MPAIEHPLLTQADEFLAALLAFEAAIPDPQPDAGAIDDSKGPRLERERRPSLGTVYVPGSGDNVPQNVATTGTPTNPGVNARGGNSSNSGGGGGGGW